MSVRKSTGDSQVRGPVMGGRGGHRCRIGEVSLKWVQGGGEAGYRQPTSALSTWSLWVILLHRGWGRVGGCGFLGFP